MSKKDLAAAKKALAGHVASIAATLAEIAGIRDEAQRSEERLLTRVGIDIDAGAALLKLVSPDADWREWAREQVPGVAVGTVYRYRHAGAVARILEGAPQVSQVSYLTLVPGYRFLAAVKNGSDEEKEQGRKQVHAWWTATLKSAGRGKVPTTEQALAVAEDLQPATQGKEGRTAEERTQAQEEKNERTRNTPKEPADTAGESQVETVDPAFVESAQTVIDSQVRGKVRTFKEKAGIDVTPEQVRSIMVMTIRDCLEHGLDVMALAMSVKPRKRK